MRNRLSVFVATGGLLLCSAPSANAAVLGTFDTDNEGWTTLGDVTSYTHQSTGGNPDGWLRIVDAATGAIFYLIAPDNYLGDQSAANGTTLSFDALVESRSGGALAEFGTITLSSSTDAYSVDNFDVPATIGAWETFSVPLTADAWGATETAWSNLLSDLTEIRIRMEMINGRETVGFDNFVFEVPEPASAALLSVGLAAIARRRSV